MSQHRAYSLCVSAALLLAVVRCRTDHIPTAPGVVAVSLDPPAATLRLGTVVKLTPTVTVDGQTSARAVRFDSSDPTVVDVADDGLLRALRIGTAAVTARLDASSATALVTVIAGVPTSIEKTVGDSQVTAAGSVVPIPPAVILRDSAGNPVPGVIITFSGTGAVAGASPTTNANGVASVTSWTLANEGGVNELTATAAGVGYVTFRARGTAPTIEVGSAGLAASLPAGSSAPITQVIPITNAGSGTLGGLAVGAVTFVGAAGWLTASIEKPTAPTNLRLAANPVGLAVGTYAATIPVVAANAMNRVEEVVFTLTIDAATTSTGLTSSVNPSAAGQAVTFTAAVTASGIVPTGSVQFKDGDVPLGAPVTLGADGTAALMSSALTLASSPHVLTAEYSGDAKARPSVSSALRQVVTPAATIVRLASSAAVISVGTPITFTATVTSAGDNPPAGTVEFRDGSTVLGSAVLSGGVAAFTTQLSPGTHVISAAYSGDATHGPSSSVALSQQIALASTSVRLVSSANPAVVGGVVTFTATVSGTLGAPTGTVTFRDAASTLGTVSLTGGVASLATAALTASAAPHVVTATYDGDAAHGGSTSAAIEQFIDAAPTSLTLSSSASTSTPGEAVTFSVTIRGASTTPTGSVTFRDGSAILGTVPVVGGGATFSTSALAATGAPHDITAEYSGDANNGPSRSAALMQSVVRIATSTALSSSANPAALGQPITFTATVTSAGGNISGTVQFMDGTLALGAPQTLSASGEAKVVTSTLSLATSPHNVTALYSGDAAHVASASLPLAQVVELAPTTSSLNASSATAILGERVIFSALVRSVVGTPSGTVQFLDGEVVLGAVEIGADGIATFATTTLAPGSHLITARYAGAAGYLASNSSLTYLVSKATPTNVLTASATGQTTTLVARIAGTLATPTGTVTFKDGTTTLGAATVVDGVATLATLVPPFAGAPHSIIAQYSGDANYSAIASAPFNFSITEATLALERTAGTNPSAFGSVVTFTATASAVDAGRPMPTGKVQFKVDEVDVGAPVLLVNGRASFSTSSLPVSATPHVIGANFSGDINFKQAFARGLAQTITP